MLNEGCILMATGMGTVFSFLVILWFAVSCMSKIVIYLNKIFPEAVKTAPAPVKTSSSDVEIAIAIAAAKRR
ncbi:MAG: OadG family protein [Candidatus Gastranaerophilales bacterium]|nr:OadG family protein [Candidatus Gastranaerophilales bacterium]